MATVQCRKCLQTFRHLAIGNAYEMLMAHRAVCPERFSPYEYHPDWKKQVMNNKIIII